MQNLKHFSHSYKAGSIFSRALWLAVSRVFFDTSIPHPYWYKRALLRLFGARIGKKVVIKQHVRIKYPWFLKIGDYSWIGEGVWIDNLAQVNIASHVCISQGAFLETGSHDYRTPRFNLITSGITLEDGVWICAYARIGPGVIARKESMLGMGGVAMKDLEAQTIYAGNPAKAVKQRPT